LGVVAVSGRATNEELPVVVGRGERCGARERERERDVVGGALEIGEKDLSVRVGGMERTKEEAMRLICHPR
jgi:hypothetical protein